MKGLSNHILSTYKEVEREIERDLNFTEVPYLEEDYRNWMSENDDKKENVVDAYVSYLKSADLNLFLFEEDFFEQLKRAFIKRHFDEITELFDKYIGIINEWLEDSKTEDVGIRTKLLSDWRSGYRNYRKFIEYRIAQLEEQKNNTEPNTEKSAEVVAPKPTKKLFMDAQFGDWLKKHRISATASYISYIKTLNKDFFCKLQPEGTDLLALIPKYLKEQPEQLIEIMGKLGGLLNEEIKNAAEPSKYLLNGRSAFRQYVKFIIEEIVDNCTDTAAANEEIQVSPVEIKELHGNVPRTSYENNDLVTLFRNRLFTQDRISQTKDVFYPIRLIKQLFKNSNLAQANDNGAWMNNWINNCIEEIVIHTDKGNYKFGNIKLLEIQPDHKQVIVTLANGETAVVLTETKDHGMVTLESQKIDDIQIDHTPLMAEILKENYEQLPALQKLTAIIREVAASEDLKITSKNSLLINTAVFADVPFTDLEALIPQLKKELILLQQKSTLCLMSQAENLRKK